MKKMAHKPIDSIIERNENREPLSTRVLESTKSFLEHEAQKRNLTISKLAAAILDDYANDSINQGRKHEPKRS